MSPRLIYLAGPYRGETESDIYKNIRSAEDYAIKITEEYPGWFAVCPHRNTAWLGGLQPDEYFLNGTLEMMRACKAILMLPGWESSEGATIERDEAEMLGIPVIEYFELYKLDELVEKKLT